MGIIAALLFLLSCAIGAGFCYYFYKTIPPVFIHEEHESGHLVFIHPVTSEDNANFAR